MPGRSRIHTVVVSWKSSSVTLHASCEYLRVQASNKRTSFNAKPFLFRERTTQIRTSKYTNPARMPQIKQSCQVVTSEYKQWPCRLSPLSSFLNMLRFSGLVLLAVLLPLCSAYSWAAAKRADISVCPVRSCVNAGETCGHVVNNSITYDTGMSAIHLLMLLSSRILLHSNPRRTIVSITPLTQYLTQYICALL